MDNRLTPANEQERRQVEALAKAVQESAVQSMELAYVDQGTRETSQPKPRQRTASIWKS